LAGNDCDGNRLRLFLLLRVKVFAEFSDGRNVA
jgi:hypothetical protein